MTIRQRSRAGVAYSLMGQSASKCRSRSTGRPSLPRIELGQEPGGLSVGGEEVDDGIEIEGVVACVEGAALDVAVGQKSFALGVRQEFHGSLRV